jgi:hypothetical protein
MTRNPIARPAVSDGIHVLVVIDHRMARIYKADLCRNAPQCIIPYDANGVGRHLHFVQDESHDQPGRERMSFYEAVARTLQNAGKILLFGSDAGAGSAMVQLLTKLQHNHRGLAKRVVASIVVDDTHLSESQLLTRAREFYASQSLTPQGETYETFF